MAASRPTPLPALTVNGPRTFSSPRRELRSVLMLRRSSWQDIDVQPVEAGHAVRLGPERDPARRGKGLVGRGVKLLSLERDREPIALRPQAQRVPFVRRNLHVRGRK